MKKNIPMVFLLAVVAVLPVFFADIIRAAIPDSEDIAAERNRFAESRDKARTEKDPFYARSMELKARELDYLLAKAYIRENRPDAAINLLQELIEGEQAENEGRTRRRFRSCRNEARYYKELRQAYILKQDTAGEKEAGRHHAELFARAILEQKREEREEGRSLRFVED